MYFSKRTLVSVAILLFIVGIFLGSVYDFSQVFSGKHRLSIPETVNDKFESLSEDYKSVTISTCLSDGSKIYKVEGLGASNDGLNNKPTYYFDFNGDVMIPSAVHKDPSGYSFGNAQDGYVSVLGSSIVATDCQILLSKN